ncbi:MAG TPA: type II toxin-antitoxin system Phd/YefM family antitoxin [Acidimicrobiales bacterium]|nr:type II toxin-antitoxin system Phd/YefM family antitoxin [Acidimicrobiales bacterium]
MGSLSVEDAGARLGDVVAGVRSTGERAVLLLGGEAAGVIVRPRDLASMEETIEMLSSADAMRAITEGDAAFMSGDILVGESLKQIDTAGRFATAASSVPDDERWELMLSGSAHKAIGKLPGHVSDLVLRFMFERLQVDPQRAGIELRGNLHRRMAARVETETVVWRLDTVKHACRVLAVLHRGGLLGQADAPRL